MNLKRRNTKRKLIIITILLSICIAMAIVYNINKSNSSNTIGAVYEVTLSENNCKVSNEDDKVTIEKYNGGASSIIIDEQIGEQKIESIDKEAFVECYNLDSIIIDKDLAAQIGQIENFEIDEEYEDEEYVQYITTKEYSEAYKKYIELSEEDRAKSEVIPRKYDIPLSAINSEAMKENYNVNTLTETEIPSDFDLRDVININVENQEQFGICYAYASLNSVETNLALNNNDIVDLSEVHLSLLADNCVGYGGWFIDANDSYYNQNYGPVYESEWALDDAYYNEYIYNYLTGAEVSNKRITEFREQMKETTAKQYVKETVNFPSINTEKYQNQSDINLAKKNIKLHIMNYGSLYASIASSGIHEEGDICVLNTISNSWEAMWGTDHAISIIGWDDNFDKNNFPTDCRPENNGAYLALNSWGDEWGEQGTFWISYEDIYVEQEMSGVILVESNKNISISSNKYKNIDTNEYVKNTDIIKGDNIQLEIDLGIKNQLSETEFDIYVKSPCEEYVTDKITISENYIKNNKGKVVLNFETILLETGAYTVTIQYGEEQITTSIKINSNIYDFEINEDENTLTITNYNGKEKDLIIPEEFLGYEVTGIGDYAFSGIELDTITIGTNITYLGEEITDYSTIIYCYTDSAICRYAAETGRTYLMLDFDYELDGEPWSYDVETHKLYTTVLHSEDEECEWDYLKKVIYEIEIANPSFTDEVIDTIGYGQFSDYTNLKKITLPDTITTIGEEAFYNCTNLEEINIPEGITEICTNTFANCEKLQSIELPETLESIGWNAFENCLSLEEINIPENVLYMGSFTFAGCENLQSITLSDSLEYIGESTFENCIKLESIEVPDSVYSIECNAFSSCISLSSITLPSYLEYMGESAFYGCVSLQEIELPEGLTEISASLFEECQSLKVVTVPEGIEKINMYAFYNCINLDNVNLPNSLEIISEGGFAYCEKLKEITLPDDIGYLGSGAFYGCITLEKIEIPQYIETIYDQTFAGCTNLKTVEFNEGLKYIEYEAFYGCTKLETVEFPTSLKDIGDSAFNECSKLKTVKFNEGLKTIGSEAFSSTDIEEIIIPDTVETIYSWAFDYLYDLKKIDLPQTIQGLEYGFIGDSVLNIDVDFGDKTEIELELNDLLKRALDENDILYSNNKVYISHNKASKIDIENKKVVLSKRDVNKNSSIEIKVGDGNLNGFIVKYTSSNEYKEEVTTDINFGKYTKATADGSNFVEGIKSSELIKNLKDEINKNNTITKFEIYKDNKLVEDENTKLATGMELRITNNNETTSYQIVATGDITGDGLMNDSDLLILARYMVGYETEKGIVKGAKLRASDIVKDGKFATDGDLLKLAKILVELENL